MNRFSLIHNMTAANTNRIYGMSCKGSIHTSNRLSSGYRINSAKDDASGLAITEKIRKHTGGLTSAVYNAQTGVSLLQVADGALHEVHDILQRTNELAIQAANGTNSAMERKMIQNEIEQSLKEIERIGASTSFNDIKLFQGEEYNSISAPPATNPGGSPEVMDLKGNTFYKYGSSTALSDAEAMDEIRNGNTIYTTPVGNNSRTVTRNVWAITGLDPSATARFSKLVISAPKTDTLTNDKANLGNTPVNLDTIVSCANTYYSAKNLEFTRKGNSIEVVYTGADDSKDITAFSMKWGSPTYTAITNGTRDFTFPVTPTPQTQAINGTHFKYSPAVSPSTPGPTLGPTEYKTDIKQLHLQLGADPTQGMVAKLERLDREKLGLKDLDVTTEEKATKAIDQIGDALAMISKQRSYIGAVDNRLGHTVKSLNNTIENLTAAYAKIRDTDMAKEAVTNTNETLLAQFDEAMLAQANQMNDKTLALLQES